MSMFRRNQIWALTLPACVLALFVSLAACDDRKDAVGPRTEGLSPQDASHTLDLVTLELPADFKLTRNGDGEPMRKVYGYSRYEWTGSDRSRVIIEAVNNHEPHTGWTGLLESECNVDIGPRPAHLDVANASVDYEDRIVHANIDLAPQLALMFVAHARSRQRQAELLNAVHSLRVRPGWGIKE